MVHRVLCAVAFAVMLSLLTTPAWAGFQEGVAAHKRGDYATAVREFRPLAEKGYANAQTYLGLMYVNGQGLPQDDVLAHMWCNLAAAQGYKKAVKSRDIMVGIMTSDQLAEAQRLAREWVAKHRAK